MSQTADEALLHVLQQLLEAEDTQETNVSMCTGVVEPAGGSGLSSS